VGDGRYFDSQIVESFEDEMLRILCVAAVVSLVLGIATEGLEKGWMEGTSILAAVVIIVTVTSGNNWVKEQQFKKLNAIASKKNVNVYRSGHVENISVDDLLVGDVQIVETGEIISVDGFLLEGHNLIADESSMTGEPLGIKKNVPSWAAGDKANPFIISSSKILEGTGRMLVLAIGEHSQYGILKKKIQASDDETPLQQKLGILAEQIGHVGMVAAGLTFICMLGHIIHGAYASGDFTGSLFNLGTLNHLVEAFIVAVSIIVVAVPEGLPLAVTIALAYSVGKMKEENNLVRFLQACETMGGADNICSDKTGTLTKNKMTVTRMFVQERTVDKILKGFLTDKIAELFSLGVALNSSANPIFAEKNGTLEIEQIGNKTDCALLEVAHILGYEYRKVRKDNDANIIKVVPFSSETKTMSTVVNSKGKVLVFSKGAPDYLLKNCAFYLNAQGEPTPITDAFKNTLLSKLQEFAEGTLRTLLLAYRPGANETADTPNQDIEKNLIVIGMVGIKDPIREQVPHAVQLCYRAGVKVRMITGDNPETAVAIAKEAGILPADWKKKNEEDYTVMTGQQFRNFVEGLDTDEDGNEFVKNIDNFRLVRDQLKVLARSSPTDKYIMATGLKQLHHVVAMTGDGTNDAPALKKADIGFAMGIAGTEVAKEASGIILLDDNFSSIVTAMKWGRNIFDSIRKFLQFQLTVNMCALTMAFAGAAVLKESPLSPIQMLWVNLIMDTLASLALATEPPSDELLERKPYSRFENLITPDMWKNIITQGTLQIVILGAILFKGTPLITQALKSSASSRQSA
jgi:P-type Ca2+ transporter type 2B